MGETLTKVKNLKNHRLVQGIHFYSFGLLKRLYSWVLSWAESKYSSYALAVLAFIESSFFPIPPDVLQIALSVAKPKKSYRYASIALFFSVLGGILGYFIGSFLFESIGRTIIHGLGYEEQFAFVGEMFKENAFLAIFAAALTPIPYKVFTIAAGVWQVGLFPLIIASILGRGLRFFLVGTLTFFLGERVKVFIDKYFNWISVGILVAVMLGYAGVKYYLFTNST